VDDVPRRSLSASGDGASQTSQAQVPKNDVTQPAPG